MINKKTTIEFDYQAITFPRQWDKNAENVTVEIDDDDGNISYLKLTEVEQVDELLSELYAIKSILYNAKKSRPEEAEA